MKKYRHINNPVAAIIFVLSISGCIREDFETCPITGDEKTDVTISVSVPGIPSVDRTRALDPAGESEVKDIVVLVFEGDDFKYRADAYKVEPTSENNVKTFSVSLKTGQCDLWILANSKSIIDAYNMPANATKTSLRQNLLLEINGKWNTASTGFTPLPRWGEKTGVNITPNLIIKDNDRVPLIRSVAKVDVTIDRSRVPSSDFTMNGVNLYHWSNSWQLIPDASAFGSDPTVEERISGNTATTSVSQPQVYSASDRDPDGFFTNVIYVPETPAGTAGALTGNPCLLINGAYKGTAGWYKAEFLDAGDNQLPLLRNYLYHAVITGVGGRGYATVDEAYKSKAQNLTVQLHYHQDAALTNVMYDGQYWLAWDPDKFELDKEKHDENDTHNIFRIESNCEDGWRWTGTVDEFGQPVTWLTIPDADRSGPKDTRGNFRFLVEENTGAPHKAFVHFTAGRMDMSVEVVQSDESNMGIYLLDADDNPLGDIFWVNTVEKKIQERMLRVKWTPADAKMSVTVHPGTANDYPVFYESGGDIPAGTVDGEGLHEYHLKFSPLNNDEALANPNNYFVEQPFRTRYTFTLDYHGKQVQKDLIIAHHLHLFHLIEYNSDGYLLGLGHGDQRLWFGTSAPFDAELTNDYEMVTLNGVNNQTGPGFNPDGNMGPGEYFSDKFFWFVRMKNPTPERRNQYETIKIRFRDSELPDTSIVLRPLAFLPNCYIVAPGSSVQVPVRNPWDARWRSRHPNVLRMPVLPPLPTTGDFTCELLWEDDNGLINNVRFTPANTFDPYRTEITVETNPGHGEGNAVIALLRDGTIIWSWHIWVTSYDPDNSPVYAYNLDDQDPMHFMDRNLGAIANNNNGTENRFNSIGMYYQGGRKDPFPPANYIPAQGATVPLSDHLLVFPDNAIIKTAVYEPGTPEETLLRTIENPATFITAPQAPYDWLAGNIPERWEPYQRWADGESTTYKSVYDPCPEGWVVPQPWSKAPGRGYPWSVPGKLGDFYPSGNMSLLRDNFGIITSKGEFYPASGFISHVDGNYTEIGLSMRVPVTSTYNETAPEFTGLGTFIYRATNSEFAGYENSTHAQGMNIRCARVDYYKQEND